MMTTLSHSRATDMTALAVGILLIAANLRAPITSLPPLLDPIRADLGLGTTAAGALTTLPLLAFALVSPASAGLARRCGLERSLVLAVAAIAIGIVLRSAGSAAALFLGTTVIGIGIAVGNVLLPSLVKRDFPTRIATLTGAYALAMGIAAALGSAAVVPLARHWGWQGALAALLVLPLAALLVWISQRRQGTQPAAGQPGPVTDDRAALDNVATGDKRNARQSTVWRSALAWQVTLFLGLNSTIYYIAITWLPDILADAGLSAAQAGSVHGAMQLATAVPGLALGPILSRGVDQRLVAAAVTGLSSLGLAGLLLAPQWALIWSLLFGMGTGAGIILGLTFIGLRTANARQAASLSGMAQCAGYLLAAGGPMAMGSLHDALGSWQLPLLLCLVLALFIMAFGLLAGRDRQLDS